MNSNKWIRAAFFVAGFFYAGLGNAMVGTISVGLGQMDQDIGQLQTSFAADAVLETEDMTVNTRVHYQPGMVRDEMNVGGQEMITIRRFDLDKVWTIMGQGMYMETAADQANDRSPEYKLVSREMIGPDTVNGMATTKYKSLYESADGRFGGFTWYTEDNIAVKGFLVSETNGEKQRIKYEFTNLERGPQSDSLFEVPAGYQRFDMNALAGGMQGMQGMQDMMGQQPGAAGAYGAPPPAPTGGQPTAQDAVQTGEDEDSLADVVADEAQKSAEDSVRDETRRGVRDSVRKGFGKLFGR